MALFGRPKPPPPEEPKRDTPPRPVQPPAAVVARHEPKPTAPEPKREAPRQPESASQSSMKKEVSAVIGSSIVIKGELLGEEELVIEGRVEGKINIKNNLIIGQKGSVEADVTAKSVVINGRVHGNIVAERVEIVASGSLEGNIKAPKISIADGAHFKGSVDMGQGGNDAKPTIIPSKPALSGSKPLENLKL